MTIAVAEALMDIQGYMRDPENWNVCAGTPEREDQLMQFLIARSLKKWGNAYPDAGYGARFIKWLRSGEGPYNSFGNGSAMRVSAAGWLYDTMEETMKMAKLSAVVTHNHPEGIKGAQAVAAAIFMARSGGSKTDIREHIEYNFGYDLSRTCDEIRPDYRHIETCQATVPEAVTAFLEGEDFEDVIRTAVSLGGDSDTLTCIAGSIAEAYYGVPDELVEECRSRVLPDMLEVIDRFYTIFKKDSNVQ